MSIEWKACASDPEGHVDTWEAISGGSTVARVIQDFDWVYLIEVHASGLGHEVDGEFELLNDAMVAALAAIPKFTPEQMGRPPLSGVRPSPPGHSEGDTHAP